MIFLPHAYTVIEQFQEYPYPNYKNGTVTMKFVFHEIFTDNLYYR